MQTPQLHIDDSIYYGFNKCKKYFKFAAFITLLQIALISLSFLIEIFGSSAKSNFNPILYYTLTVLISIISIYISLGITQESLKVIDNKTPKFKKVFKVKLNLFLKYVLQIILTIVLGLTAILIIGGLIAGAGVMFSKNNYILAGLAFITALISLLFSIWAVLSFTVIKYTLVDKNCTVIESFKESYNLSLKQKFSIIGFNIAKSLVWVIGLLCLGVGLLVAYPLTQIATAHFYRSLYSTTK